MILGSVSFPKVNPMCFNTPTTKSSAVCVCVRAHAPWQTQQLGLLGGVPVLLVGDRPECSLTRSLCETVACINIQTPREANGQRICLQPLIKQ